ncbi:nitrate- and nitrite sensing domain-containing protein [Flexibacterium corallicola]|uniref:nitrate- and nitrite sensing domain-containing protein n=1 Tax=Flexibacterium corallicola TaxID=3037259 RepID=UPI00286F065F|nr:nitrate- and nitrite sensing domain-containing protein [Pseudovibrio sp. M1P-2-3]
MLTAVPLLCALVFACWLVYTVYAQVDRHERLRPVIELSDSADDLIHQIQLERSLTSALISSRYGREEARNLIGLRVQIDDQLVQFEALVQLLQKNNPEEFKGLQPIFAVAGQLSKVRELVQNKKVSANTAVGLYNRIVVVFMRIMAMATEASPSIQISQELLPLLQLVGLREAGGLERGYGVDLLNRLNTERPLERAFMPMLEALGAEKVFMRAFEAAATPTQMEILMRVTKSPEFQDFNVYRLILSQLPETQNSKGITASLWFESATERLDELYHLSEEIAERAKAVSATQLATLQKQLLAVTVIAITLIFAVLVFSIISLTGITGAMARLLKSMSELAKGKTYFEVPQQERRDEIGELSRVAEAIRMRLWGRELRKKGLDK